MKRVLVLFLIATLLFSISGCVAKTEHARLLEEKRIVEKNYEELVAKDKELRAEISVRRDDIRDLRTELKAAKAKIRNLDVQLAESKEEIAEFKK